MPYLTFTIIASVDLARHGVSLAKDLGIWGLWYKRFCRCLFGHEFTHSRSGSAMKNLFLQTKSKLMGDDLVVDLFTKRTDTEIHFTLKLPLGTQQLKCSVQFGTPLSGPDAYESRRILFEDQVKEHKHLRLRKLSPRKGQGDC